MFSVITGKQRAGKSLYAVSEVIVEYLKTTTRPIVTSLPINPDWIIRHITKDIKKRRQYMERIFVFCDTRHISLRQFAKLNPLFWEYSFYSSQNRIIDENGKYRSDRSKSCNIIDIQHVKEFWKYTPVNSVVVFDEAYESFSSLDSSDRSEDNKERRKELLSMCRQHGHFKLDIFMISHSYQDLDGFLKRGIQYLYVIKNSKYTNIFDNRYMRGLKWPFQFFEVVGYEYGEDKPCDRWVIRPSTYFFKCYNSFSHSFKLGFHQTTEKQESTDIGTNWKYNLKRFIRQFWIWIVVFLGILIGGYQFAKLINKLALSTNRDVHLDMKMTGKGKDKKEDDKEKLKSKSEKENIKSPEKEEKKPPKITLISATQINYSDGLKIKKGSIYEGFMVEKIEKGSVTLSNDSGKSFKVAIEGIRR